MSRSARLARGWAIGVVATIVAAASHAIAGGPPPSALAIGLGTVFAGLVGTALIGRRAGFIRTSLIVAISQLAFHLGFSLLSTGPASAVASGSPHHAMIVLGPAGSVTHSHADPGMWIAHGIAAALTVLYLRRVERSAWNVLASAGGILLRRLTTLPPVLTKTRLLSTGWTDAPAPRAGRLADAIARRGPPVAPTF